MSSALSRILITQLVRTSGDLAISLKSTPCGVASKASSLSMSIMGTSLTKSVKSDGFHFPGSNNAASTMI